MCRVGAACNSQGVPCLEEMLPSDYLAAYEASPPPIPMAGPLPGLVTHHYSSGGCFILAGALHQATGWPIEVYFRDGQPRHAYIVDVDRALDVVGFRPLAAARAGAERVARVDLPGLVSLLRTVQNGDILVRDIRRPRSQVAAENAAAALLEAVGMPPPPWVEQSPEL
jgi:hypothetical protein